MTERSPCLKRGCSLCCCDTEMPLTKKDISRLRAAGHTNFYRTVGRTPTLKNVRGKCVFLEDGHCAVYGIRPSGCRLYPIIFDEGEEKVVLDGLCPYHDEFSITEKDSAALFALIRKIETEKE